MEGTSNTRYRINKQLFVKKNLFHFDVFIFQHVLLETEAQNVRSSILTAFQHIKSFGEEVEDTSQKLSYSIQQIEGSTTDNALVKRYVMCKWD